MRNLSKNTLNRFISANVNNESKLLNNEKRLEVSRLHFQYGTKIEKSRGYEKVGILGNVGKRFGKYFVLTLNPNQVPKAARKLINFYRDYEKQ
jgi:hypothetical protein